MAVSQAGGALLDLARGAAGGGGEGEDDDVLDAQLSSIATATEAKLGMRPARVATSNAVPVQAAVARLAAWTVATAGAVADALAPDEPEAIGVDLATLGIQVVPHVAGDTGTVALSHVTADGLALGVMSSKPAIAVYGVVRALRCRPVRADDSERAYVGIGG